MYVNPALITNNISEAYDTFASLGFEVSITIDDFNLDTGDTTTYVINGLQLNKDTIKVGGQYQFLTEAHPTVFIKESNLPIDPNDPNARLQPDSSWRFRKTIDPDHQYSLQSSNKIFTLAVIRLKP